MNDTGEDLRLLWAGGNAHDLGGSLGAEFGSGKHVTGSFGRQPGTLPNRRVQARVFVGVDTGSVQE